MEHIIEIKFKKEELELIKLAANIKGMTVEKYVISTALEAAQKVIEQT